MNHPRLLVATGNAGKAREVRALLRGVEVSTLADHPLEMPEETGTTFEANAILKAEFARDALGIPVLADDSGLEVDALDGRPGVRSARYAPGTDADRYRALLDEMSHVDQRSARFVCAMALAVPGESTRTARGSCEGRIGRAPEGEGGFGYDPVFRLPDDRAMATLSGEEKNAISHRGAALRALLPALRAVLGSP